MKVVGAIIRNQKAEYLLQLRDDKAPRFKNAWTLFGGLIEEGESEEEALYRELEEELALSSDMIQSVKQIQINERDDDFVQYIYEVVTNVALDQLVLGEGAAMDYVAEDALFDRDFAFNIEEVLMRYAHPGVELYDLVNRDDEVIGTTYKKKAHNKGLLHRIAAVFVFNEKGELYVQQHSSDGKWDHSVGGHVSKGESYAVAASREAEEELGIRQPLEELALSLMGDEYPHMQHIFGLYSCVADPSWTFVPNDEVQVIFPMTVEDIRRAMIDDPERFTRGFRITMAEYARIHKLPTIPTTA